MSTSSPAGSPPTPDWIPSLAEILRYFSGALRLMAGRPDGLHRLDLSAEGFWRSFAAIPVALPPTILSWLEFETMEREGPRADTGRAAVYAAHALADLTAWLLPVLVLVLIAQRIGFNRKIVPLVVASNWGGALLTWAFVPLLALLVLAGPSAATDVLALAFAVMAVVLTTRLVMASTGSDVAAAGGIVVLMVVCSLVAYAAVADLTGIALV